MFRFEHTIRKYRNRKNTVTAMGLVLIVLSTLAAGFCLYLTLLAANLVPPAPLFLIGAGLRITLALVVIWVFWKTWPKFLDRFKAARSLDLENGDTDDTFQNALELKERHDPDHPLIRRVIDKAEKTAQNTRNGFDWKRIQILMLSTFFILTGTVVLTVTLPEAAANAWRFLRMNGIPEVQHKEFVEVTPGNLSVLRSDRVEIRVLDPEPKVEHHLFFRRDDVWRQRALPDHQTVFSGLDESFDYYVRTPWAVSDTFRIDVFDMPVMQELTVRYTYPEYTGLEPVTEYNSDGHLQGFPHTLAHLRMELNNPIETARILFDDGSVDSLSRLGRNSFETTIDIVRDGGYKLQFKDFLGTTSRPVHRTIRLEPDNRPEIAIAYPARDTVLTQNLLFPLRFLASDDFGLHDLILRYSINGTEEQTETLVRRIHGTLLTHDHVFDLRGLSLVPGDRISYRAQISDNAQPPQTSFSRSYEIRYPSIGEVYEQIEQEEERGREILEERRDQARTLQEEFEQKRREMMKREEMDWEDKKELENLMDRQEKIADDVEDLASDYREMVEKMEQNEALSQETLQKMARIQELMEEISSEELQQAMEKMRESMENMDPEVLRKAMEEMQFSMEDMVRKLDQTIDLLEDIKKEQALQKSVEIAEEMLEMQEELAKDTENADGSETNLDQRQQDIADKMDNLLDQLDQADRMLDPQKDAELKKKMQELIEQMQQDRLSQDLQESAQSLSEMQDSQGEPQQMAQQQAMQSQQNAMQKMQSMLSKLNEMQSMMSMGGMGEIMEIVQITLRRLVLFSRLHEQVQNRFAKDPYVILPDLLAHYEGIQSALNELYAVPQVLLHVHPKFFYDTNFTLNTYRSVFSDINDARFTSIPTYLPDILKGLNLMAYDLLQTQQNMQNMMQSGQPMPGSGTQALMQALEQMGQQQMAMNMLTQQLMQQMGQGGGMTREMRESLQRIAASEEQLAENLRRALQNHPEAMQQGSALQSTLEDLEEVTRKLRQNRLDSDLIEQQERILSRLLDAQKSIHQREFSQKRKGKTGEQEGWEMPPEMRLEFERMRKKALLEQDFKLYPQQYRSVIREYLKKLQERSDDSGDKK